MMGDQLLGCLVADLQIIADQAKIPIYVGQQPDVPNAYIRVALLASPGPMYGYGTVVYYRVSASVVCRAGTYVEASNLLMSVMNHLSVMPAYTVSGLMPPQTDGAASGSAVEMGINVDFVAKSSE